MAPPSPLVLHLALSAPDAKSRMVQTAPRHAPIFTAFCDFSVVSVSLDFVLTMWCYLYFTETGASQDFPLTRTFHFHRNTSNLQSVQSSASRSTTSQMAKAVAVLMSCSTTKTPPLKR